MLANLKHDLKQTYVLALPELQQQTLGHDSSQEANKHEECFHPEHSQQ